MPLILGSVCLATSIQRGITMQVSVESTSALERKMNISVPAKRIEKQVTKRLQQTAKRAKSTGFSSW